MWVCWTELLLMPGCVGAYCRQLYIAARLQSILAAANYVSLRNDRSDSSHLDIVLLLARHSGDYAHT